MSKQVRLGAVLAALLALLTPSDASAWGAAHVGYTHVGPSGVQHYGRTVAVGPNGAYSGAHASSYGAGGAYHVGTAAGYSAGGYRTGTAVGGYHYNTGTAGGAYHYGYSTGTGYGYAGGVYRRY